MSTSVFFDTAFKKLYANDTLFGYVSEKVKPEYPNYFSKDQWNSFLKEMPEDLQKLFNKEIKEHRNKRSGKVYPPKMASVASSSRLTYLMLRQKECRDAFLKTAFCDSSPEKEFFFECDLPIDGIFDGRNQANEICAHPDALLLTDDRVLFIESKCHELYENHNLDWSTQYLNNGICNGKRISFNIDTQYVTYYYGTMQKDAPTIVKSIHHNREKQNSNWIRISPTAFDLKEKEKLYLDVKQFVCHLLGIANYESKKQKELIYLYFVPASKVVLFSENDEYATDYEKLEQQFNDFCNSKYVRDFCKKHGISIHLFFVKTTIEETVPEKQEVKFLPINRVSYIAK